MSTRSGSFPASWAGASDDERGSGLHHAQTIAGPSTEVSSPPAWNLNQLVAELRGARSTRSEWLNEETERRHRPSRDGLVNIVKGLRAVLFPSHFGTPDVNDSNIDFYVGHTLDNTLRALEQQVRRALPYSPECLKGDADVCARQLTQQFAAALPGVRAALELDVRAAFQGDPAATSRSEVIFCYPGVSAVLNHRLAHQLYKLGLRLLARMVAEIAHSETGIDIHPGAQIGESFFIDHGTGVVIGETTIIGNRVRLYQGVTLGAKNFPTDEDGSLQKGLPRHPIIGDDVVIYAGATILGRVTIGNNSTIGGNVWLTRSLPPHSVITQAQTRVETFDAGAGI